MRLQNTRLLHLVRPTSFRSSNKIGLSRQKYHRRLQRKKRPHHQKSCIHQNYQHHYHHHHKLSSLARRSLSSSSHSSLQRKDWERFRANRSVQPDNHCGVPILFPPHLPSIDHCYHHSPSCYHGNFSRIQKRGMIWSFFSNFTKDSKKEEDEHTTDNDKANQPKDGIVVSSSSSTDNGLEREQQQQQKDIEDQYLTQTTEIEQEPTEELPPHCVPSFFRIKDSDVKKIVGTPLGDISFANDNCQFIHDLCQKLASQQEFHDAFRLLQRLRQEVEYCNQTLSPPSSNDESLRKLVSQNLRFVIEKWRVAYGNKKELLGPKFVLSNYEMPSPAQTWTYVQRHHKMGIPITLSMIEMILQSTIHHRYEIFKKHRGKSGLVLVDSILEAITSRDPKLQLVGDDVKPTIITFNTAISSWEAFARDKYSKDEKENFNRAKIRLLEILDMIKAYDGVAPNKDTYHMIMRVLAYEGNGDKVEQLLEELYHTYMDILESEDPKVKDSFKEYIPTIESFSLVLFAWSQSRDKTGKTAQRATVILERMLELESNKDLLPGFDEKVTASCFDMVLNCWSQVDSKKKNSDKDRYEKIQNLYNRMVELSKTDPIKAPTAETQQIMKRITAQLPQESTIPQQERKQNKHWPQLFAAHNDDSNKEKIDDVDTNFIETFEFQKDNYLAISSSTKDSSESTPSVPPIASWKLSWAIFQNKLEDGSAPKTWKLLWDGIMSFEDEAKSLNLGFISRIDKTRIPKPTECENRVARIQKEQGRRSLYLQTLLWQMEMWYAALRVLLMGNEMGLALHWLRSNDGGALSIQGKYSDRLKSSMINLKEHAEEDYYNGDPRLMSLRQRLLDKNGQCVEKTNFRCIIFAQRQIDCYILSSFINHDPEFESLGLKSSMLLDNESNLAKSIKLAPKRSMEEEIQAFRSGEFNVLVVRGCFDKYAMRGIENAKTKFVINYNHRFQQPCHGTFSPEQWGGDTFTDMTDEFTGELSSENGEEAFQDYFARISKLLLADEAKLSQFTPATILYDYTRKGAGGS